MILKSDKLKYKQKIINILEDFSGINLLLSQKNNLAQIKQWFEKNQDFNIDTPVNELGETILHRAAATDNAGLIKWLINEKKANIEIQDSQGYTPWLRAVQQKKGLAAETLKDFKANQLCTNKNGENAAHFLIRSLVRWNDYNIWMCENDFLKLIQEKNTRNKNILHYACEFSNPVVVEELCKQLSKKSLVNEATNEGKTPVYYAIKSKNFEKVIDILCNNKARIEYKSAKGYTPWLNAIKFGKLDVANCLKKYGANLLCENNDGENGAHLIISLLKDNDDILNYIPKATLDKLIDKKNKNNLTPLHIACRNGEVKVIEQLCKLYPDLIATIKPPLIFDAMQNKHAKDIIPMLLQYKAITLNENNETILHLACKNSSPEIVAEICRQCPELINTEDNNKQTPLFYAIQNKNINVAKEIIVVLLSEYAKNNTTQEYRVLQYVEHKDTEGYTSWLYAIKSGNFELANCLKTNEVRMPNLLCTNSLGENAIHLIISSLNSWEDIYQYISREKVEQLINQSNAISETILHYACRDAKPDVVAKLCELYPNLVNRCNKDGCTPLFYAAQSKSFKQIIEILLKYGAKIEFINNEGYTPWLHCAKHNKLDAANFLREKGADVDVKNDKDENILCVLASYSNKEKARWLPEEKLQQLIQKEKDNNYLGFIKKLFVAAAAKVGVQLPDNYSLILFCLTSFPEKELDKDSAYAIIVDKAQKQVLIDLDKVCKTFNSFIHNMGLSEELNTHPALINTPEQLAVDICQAKFKHLTTVDEVLVIKDDEKLLRMFFESVKAETLKQLDYNKNAEQLVKKNLSDVASINLMRELFLVDTQQQTNSERYWQYLDNRNLRIEENSFLNKEEKNSELSEINDFEFIEESAFHEDDPVTIGSSWLVESFYDTFSGHGVGKLSDFIDANLSSINQDKEQLNFNKFKKLMRTVPLVEGTPLEKASEDELEKLDIELFCETILLGYIINSQNDRTKDYIVHHRKDGKIELINIANRSAFAPTTAINSVLWTLPQMQQVIPETVLKKMRVLLANDQWLTKWLLRIEIQSCKIQQLDKKFVIPITEDITTLVYENCIKLREILLTEKNLSCATVLQQLHPDKVESMSNSTDKKDILEEISETRKSSFSLFGPSYKPEDSLKKLQQLEKDNINLAEIRKQVEQGKLSDFEKLSPVFKEIVLFGSEAHNTLKQPMNWAGAKNIDKLIEHLIKSKVSFYKIRIPDGGEIEAEKIVALCKQSPSLIKLELWNSDNIDALNLLNILNACKYIEELTLKSTKNIFTWSGVINQDVLTITSGNNVYIKLDAIKKITLEKCGIKSLELRTPNLISLTLSENEYLTFVKLNATPKLLNVEISGCDNIEEVYNDKIENFCNLDRFEVNINAKSTLFDSSEVYIKYLLPEELPEDKGSENSERGRFLKFKNIIFRKAIEYANSSQKILGSEGVVDNKEVDEFEKNNQIDLKLRFDKENEIRSFASSEIFIIETFPVVEIFGNQEFTQAIKNKIKNGAKILNISAGNQTISIPLDNILIKNPWSLLYSIAGLNAEQTEGLFNKYKWFSGRTLLFQQALKKLASYNRFSQHVKISTSSKSEELIKEDSAELSIYDKLLSLNNQEKQLYTIMQLLPFCKNFAEAKQYIDAAYILIDQDYEQLSIVLFSILPASVKAKYVELGLVGIRNEKTIAIHTRRLKTDPAACLALIELGEDAKKYEKHLLAIVLSQTSPVMVSRALEQLSKIHHPLQEFENLTDILLNIYTQNENILTDEESKHTIPPLDLKVELLMQLLDCLESWPDLYENQKAIELVKELESHCMKSILNNRDEKPLLVVIIEHSLKHYSLSLSAAVKSTDEELVKDFAKQFLSCVQYGEFAEITTKLLPEFNKLDENKINIFMKCFDLESASKSVDKYLELYLDKLILEFDIEKHKDKLNSIIQCLHPIAAEVSSARKLLKALGYLKEIDIAAMKESASQLLQILSVIGGINAKSSNKFLPDSISKVYKMLKEFLNRLVSEKLLEDLQKEFLPQGNVREAAITISAIFKFNKSWLLKIVAPLQEKIKVFLETNFDDSMDFNKELSCSFSICQEGASLDGIEQFSEILTNSILDEIKKIDKKNMQDPKAATYLLLKLYCIAYSVGAQLPRLGEAIQKEINEYINKCEPYLKQCVGETLEQLTEIKSNIATYANGLIKSCGFGDIQYKLFDKKTISRTKDILLSEIEFRKKSFFSFGKTVNYKNNLETSFGYFSLKYHGDRNNSGLYDQIFLHKDSEKQSLAFLSKLRKI